MAKVFSVKDKEGTHYFTVNSVIEVKENYGTYTVTISKIIPMVKLATNSCPINVEYSISSVDAKEIIKEMENM